MNVEYFLGTDDAKEKVPWTSSGKLMTLVSIVLVGLCCSLLTALKCNAPHTFVDSEILGVHKVW